MVFVYFIVGLVNIFSQHHNYGIKIEDSNIDLRVRRSIEDAVKPEVFNLRDNLENFLKTDILKTDVLKTDIHTHILKSDVLKRKKRYPYYKKTRITYNDLLKYSSINNNNSESQTLKNRYDIFNPNYNFLFNTTTRNNQNNNTGVTNGITINRRPPTRSYPYGYAPGYEPRPNRASGYNVVTTTPVFYNYQNPNGPNFAGYGGYTANKPGYENVTPGYNSVTDGYNSAPVQYEHSSSPSTNNNPWNSALVSYPPTYSQNPYNNNFPTTNNLPYNNVPVPYKDNLPQYAINFNNGTTSPNLPYIPASNTTPGKDYIFPSINDYNLPINNNTVSPINNSNDNVSTTDNTNVTPSNINFTVTTTTARTLSGCVICNIPCPRFMRRFGMYCMPENDDDY